MEFTDLRVCALLLGAASVAQAAAPARIDIDDALVFPESLSSTADGTIYIGSLTKGVIYRALPGTTKAEPWIANEAVGAKMVLGVLADAGTGTLWVCTDTRETGEATLKTFSLRTGRPGESYVFPGGGFCNDIALKGGAAYVTDTKNGRILELRPGAAVLTLWYQGDPADSSLDGITFARDGNVYTNAYRTHHLIRVAVNKDGTAGAGTVLDTTIPLYQPDGIRLTPSGRMLMVEGQGESGNGRLDEITVKGNRATIKVLKDGFMLPTAVTVVGHTAWVLEAKLNYQRDPALKDKDPGTFSAYAVALPR